MPVLLARRVRLALLLLPTLLAAVACRSISPEDEPAWRYRISLEDPEAWRLDVEAFLPGAEPRFTTNDRSALRELAEVRDGRGRPLRLAGDHWVSDGPLAGHALRFQVPLASLIGRRRELDRGMRHGEALLTSWATWLLRPVVTPPGRRVEIEVDPDVPLAAGTDRAGQLLRIHGRDLHRSVYLGFGTADRRRVTVPAHPVLGVPRSEIEIALLPGRLVDPFDDYVESCAELLADVSELWGGFPVKRALIALMPGGRRRGITFGKVLPSSVPTVCIWIGERTRAVELPHEWQLRHEVLHLGFPMTAPSGHWLDEGLATYHESLLRVRGGWISEEELWEEWLEDMPRGLRALEEHGLSNGRGIDDTYWGGALFCLLTDLEARRRTGGKRGIEDGVRHLIHEDLRVTRRVRSLELLLETMDRGIGQPVLQDLWNRHGERGSALDWQGLLERLGVRHESGKVTLDDTAPEARWRRVLMEGEPSD